MVSVAGMVGLAFWIVVGIMVAVVGAIVGAVAEYLKTSTGDERIMEDYDGFRFFEGLFWFVLFGALLVGVVVWGFAYFFN